MITMTHAISRRCRQALAGVVLGAASMAAPQAATLDDTLGLGLGGLDPLALGGGSLVLLQPVEGLLDALLGGLGGATEGGLLSGGLLDGALLGTGLGGNLTGGGLPLLSSPIGGTGIDALSGLGDLAGGGDAGRGHSDRRHRRRTGGHDDLGGSRRGGRGRRGRGRWDDRLHVRGRPRWWGGARRQYLVLALLALLAGRR